MNETKKSQRSFKAQENGRQAQYLVRVWLRGHGIECKPAGYYESYDLLTSGNKKIEVKWSPFDTWGTKKNPQLGWRFNIHRHNTLREGDIDFYILRCEPSPQLGFKYAFHLVVPSPIKRLTVAISVRSLLTEWGKHFNRFDLLKESK